MEHFWYAIELPLEKNAKKLLPLTKDLLNNYVQRLLSAPDNNIQDLFALNLRDGVFDYGVPGLLFLSMWLHDDKAMIKLLRECKIGYLSMRLVTQEYVHKLHYPTLVVDTTNPDPIVWSALYFDTQGGKGRTTLFTNYLRMGIQKITNRGLFVCPDRELFLEVLCPNMTMLKEGDRMDYTIGGVIYFSYRKSDVLLVLRALGTGAYIIPKTTCKFIPVVDQAIVERLKTKLHDFTTEIQFKEGDRVQIVSGDMNTLTGIVRGFDKGYVIINMEILGHRSDFSVPKEDLLLVNE